jgi:hypothetical protein
MQRLWQLKVKWADPLTTELKEHWQKYNGTYQSPSAFRLIVWSLAKKRQNELSFMVSPVQVK